MNKKYLPIAIVIIVLLLLSLGYYYFYEKNNSNTNDIEASSTIDYKDSNDVDFSNYQVYTVDLNNIDSKYTITSAGVYHFTGNLSGYIYVNTTENVEIILDNVTIKNESGPCIYIESAKNTYISLVGTNNLSDGSTYSNFTDIDGAIYSKDDLFITGDGTLNLTANYLDGIVSKDDLVIESGTINITSKDDGIRGKDSVVIKTGTINIESQGDGIKSTNDEDSSKGYILIQNGNITIKSTLDAIEATSNLEIDNGTINLTTGGGATIKSTSSSWGNWNTTSTNNESAKGLKAGNSILIKNITLNENTSDDAIHSNNIIEIDTGNIVISSGDDGIHADSKITINDGTINIKESYEGIESNYIIINNGTINVVSTDDGINVNGGSDNSSQGRMGSNTLSSDNSNLCLEINGGSLYVNSGGDGLDSNGSIKMTSGIVYVDGPTDDGNGAIDYNNTFTLTGGTLIAAGSSGMAQNVSSSTQNSVIIYFSNTQSAETKVTVGDISYTPSKSFSSIVISSPSLVSNKSYTVLLNNNTYTTFTINNSLTSVGTSSSKNRMMR